MDMDSTIHVEDLELPAGVVATADPERTVVTVSIMRTPVLDEEAAEAEAAAAAAAAAEEDGETEGGEEAPSGD